MVSLVHDCAMLHNSLLVFVVVGMRPSFHTMYAGLVAVGVA